MEALSDQLLQLKASYPLLYYVFANVGLGILIFLFGFWLASWTRRKVRGAAFGLDEVDITLRPVIGQVLYYSILAITLYAVLRRLGVEATGLLAVFGAAGLAIGLALKDTLSNIAAGMMLLVLRPLNVGEYIQAPSASGTVKEVGLFSTQLRDSEGVLNFVPNGVIWAARIQNFGRHEERKLQVNMTIEYDADLELVLAKLLEALTSHPMTLDLPKAPQVLVTDFSGRGVVISACAWLPVQNWPENSSDIRLLLKKTLDKAGVRLATHFFMDQS